MLDGVPTVNVARSVLDAGIDIVNFLADTKIFPSKGEARKMVQGGGISINKEKIDAIEHVVKTATLLNNKYLLVQKGKKNYFYTTSPRIRPLLLSGMPVCVLGRQSFLI